ncbi:unnamed protein product [Schistocephalus solidus]|uniref:TACC_C domain-containing protein n=1 Tax=Schistocephalus solidus TaxID=70667 RepID=A0A183SR58_SCHSO|nr:unnamed protein product [Schistocephalus solidus]
MAFTDSESCAGLHAKGNIAGFTDLNRLISQSTANSRSPTYLLMQNTGSVTLSGEVPHRAPVLTRPYIIAAYKTLQAENACLQEALQKTSGQTSVANADDNSKTDPQSTEKLKKALEEVNEKCEDAEHVEAVIENYRNELDASRQKLEKSAEFHEILNERVARLSRDLAVERRAVVDLQSSLSEAQQQHELSTNHFEMRLSELTANLKTYEETHKLDQQTIMRLRSPQNVEGEPKDISPLAAVSESGLAFHFIDFILFVSSP